MFNNMYKYYNISILNNLPMNAECNTGSIKHMSLYKYVLSRKKFVQYTKT